MDLLDTTLVIKRYENGQWIETGRKPIRLRKVKQTRAEWWREVGIGGSDGELEFTSDGSQLYSYYDHTDNIRYAVTPVPM